jgi:hypothetical protein
MAKTMKPTTPDAGIGTNLFTFLCARFENSYDADGLQRSPERA